VSIAKPEAFLEAVREARERLAISRKVSGFGAGVEAKEKSPLLGCDTREYARQKLSDRVLS